MQAVTSSLRKEGIRYFLFRFSSLDRYFHINNAPYLYLAVEASLIDLARIFPHLEYKNLSHADAVLPGNEFNIHFTCLEKGEKADRFPISLLNIFYEPERKAFKDPLSVYSDLRAAAGTLLFSNNDGWYTIADCALLACRYNIDIPPDLLPPENIQQLNLYEQREILQMILSSPHPEKGFSILKQYGFIENHWPVLEKLSSVNQDKEYHPEGNAWEHTLEAMKYQKRKDFLVALGILLHDIGKSVAVEAEGKKFNAHAELGMKQAKKFLRGLEFPDNIIEDIAYLVKYHMVPGALPRLPLRRSEHIMTSPLFPQLLELYRCDLLSTFRGPDNYYKACRVYKGFLKNKKNPFRNGSGKQIIRQYVE